MANVSPNYPNQTPWVDKVNAVDDVDAIHVNQLYAEQEAMRVDLLNKISKTTNITSIDDTGIADGEIAIFDLTNKKIKTSDKTISTTLDSTGNTIPTGKAITDKINVANGFAGTDINNKIPLAQMPTEITNQIVKKYGARRAIGASSSTLERVWNAAGLVANVGVDNTTVANDFDSIYPWSNIKECNIEVVNGKIVVKAYKGEPSFKLDGTNGNVAIEIPIFYQAPAFPNDGYEYWGVSEFPIGGWRLSPAFIGSNGQTLRKIYIAKYNTSTITVSLTGGATTNGSADITFNSNTSVKVGDVVTGTNIPSGATVSVIKSPTSVTLNKNCTGSASSLTFTIVRPVSQSGLPYEVSRSKTSFRLICGDYNITKQHLMDLQLRDILMTLFTVEFATLNSQSIMQGVTSMPYSSSHVSVLAESNVNRVVLANAFADTYIVGQSIGIGTSLGGQQIATNRRITAINVVDASNKALVFDGSPVTTTTSQIVYSTAWYTGITDSVVATSGSKTSNSNGKYPCMYRGIENPYGNISQWLDGVNIFNRQAFVCETPSQYMDSFTLTSGVTTNGSPNITFTSSTNVKVGDIIVGTNIPSLAVVIAKTDTTATLNQNCTGDGTGLTFSVVSSDCYRPLNYVNVTTDGYTQTMGLDNKYPFARLPITVGGSSSTYYADYYYQSSALTEMALLFGGSWIYGSGAGLSYFIASFASSLTNVAIGARLSWKP